MKRFHMFGLCLLIMASAQAAEKMNVLFLAIDDLDDLPERGKLIALDRTTVYTKALATGVYKNALQGYLASTTYVDTHMGRVPDALKKSPYKDNTIVVLWSDHGFHLGEKLHWQKSTLWEEDTHCLLMMKVPGMTKPNQERLQKLMDGYMSTKPLDPSEQDSCLLRFARRQAVPAG